MSGRKIPIDPDTGRSLIPPRSRSRSRRRSRPHAPSTTAGGGSVLPAPYPHFADRPTGRGRRDPGLRALPGHRLARAGRGRRAARLLRHPGRRARRSAATPEEAGAARGGARRARRPQGDRPRHRAQDRRGRGPPGHPGGGGGHRRSDGDAGPDPGPRPARCDGFLVQEMVEGASRCWSASPTTRSSGRSWRAARAGRPRSCLKDVAVRVAPITDLDAREMVRSLEDVPAPRRVPRRAQGRRRRARGGHPSGQRARLRSRRDPRDGLQPGPGGGDASRRRRLPYPGRGTRDVRRLRSRRLRGPAEVGLFSPVSDRPSPAGRCIEGGSAMAQLGGLQDRAPDAGSTSRPVRARGHARGESVRTSPRSSTCTATRAGSTSSPGKGTPSCDDPIVLRARDANR